MPTCPHCHEYYFGNPNQCPKCYYHFESRRIIKPEEVVKREKEVIEREKKKCEWDREQRKKDWDRAQQENDTRTLALLSNAHYEYTTVYLRDSQSGGVDIISLDSALKRYAEQGWRLHSVLTNEVGKNTSSGSFGGVTSGINSTIDETILIFERCIKLAGQ